MLNSTNNYRGTETPRLTPQSHPFPSWRPRSIRHATLPASSPNTLSSSSRNMSVRGLILYRLPTLQQKEEACLLPSGRVSPQEARWRREAAPAPSHVPGRGGLRKEATVRSQERGSEASSKRHFSPPRKRPPAPRRAMHGAIAVESHQIREEGPANRELRLVPRKYSHDMAH
ncbi:PREDICTED: cardiotrophin-1 isoform X1 [Myotis brandtii]|uniref:cardiotrophin-1 isoform X1 n=1 Tax=Myotis brandtii TaxID=109478 RepID=UPI000703D67D|nr:PREDICTED: cardiotrophin-1 isoform X1 [Myotis brandtii]